MKKTRFFPLLLLVFALNACSFTKSDGVTPSPTPALPSSEEQAFPALPPILPNARPSVTPPQTTPTENASPNASQGGAKNSSDAPLDAPQREEVSEVWDVSDVDISDVDGNRKLIAFTFDDAPARTLESILAVFASFNEENPDCPASATVFCNGNRLDSTAISTLHVACTLGFELGNHTFAHLDLTTLDERALQAEINKTDELLRRVDDKQRHLLRAPFGKINALVQATAKTPILDWTIDTLDWTGISENEIYQTVFSQKFSGGIVLMHDGYEHTVSALKRLLPALKEAGYQVVNISKMAKAHGVAMRRGNVYIRCRPQK